MQSVLRVPLEFPYVLYMYGPYSFDLRMEMEALEADGLLECRPTLPYGSVILPTDAGVRLAECFPKTIARYERELASTARVVGGKTVSELEKFITAVYIREKVGPTVSPTEVAQKLHNVKPHIPLEDAMKVVRESDEIVAREVAGIATSSSGEE
jgi:hypothetical protein